MGIQQECHQRFVQQEKEIAYGGNFDATSHHLFCTGQVEDSA
jgi:hypothetical protein